MKRSPPSSSCSSTASSTDDQNLSVHNQLIPLSRPPPPATSKIAKPKVKRTRRTPNPEKRQFNNSPGRRSSIYRGVTRHRWTGRYEAHLWDKNSWNQIQNKKGKQVYLGAYDDEEAAAHTYDLAAIKYWGPDTILNFPSTTYAKEIEEMQNVSREEYLASLRRRSSGFSRGVSKYRGVARHHHNGRWEARIGRVFGNKYLYLGTYSTQEEAAAAYDVAAIEYRGLNAVTNFDISHYIKSPLPPPPTPPTPPPQFQQSSSPYFTESQEMISSLIPKPELPQSVDQSPIMDPIEENPWSLCMDSGFNPLPVPDIGLEKSSELPDLFSNAFEENIEYFFEGILGNKEAIKSEDEGINLDGIFDNSIEFDRGSLLGGFGVDGGDGGLNDVSTRNSTSVSYPFPIRICS